MLAIGIIMLVWTGFTIHKKEKVIDFGPVQISADKQHTINWPPYAGCVLIVGGIVLLLNGKKHS
jgi:hypothetical protein